MSRAILDYNQIGKHLRSEDSGADNRGGLWEQWL